MKKHLSRIVLQRLFITIILTFTVLLLITVLFVSLYADYSTFKRIRADIDNVEQTVLDRMESNLKINVPGEADKYDREIAKKGYEYITDPSLAQLLAEDTENNTDSERNIIDSNGMIIASSDPDNVGYDIKADPQLSEFCRIHEGTADMYMHDFITSPMNGTPMKYGAAFMPRLGGIYLQGQNREEYESRKSQYLSSQIRFDRIERDGYFLLADPDGSIISSTDQMYEGKTLILPEGIGKSSETIQTGKGNLFGADSYIGVLCDGSYLIAAVCPRSEIWEKWNTAIMILILIYAVVFTILFYVIRYLIAENIVKGVYSLNESLKRITAGQLDVKADYRDSIEFCELSDGINYMVDSLNGLIREANERIDAELALAAKIQASFLPRKFPAFPERDEFELYASMTPAKEVGGDFYDFFLIDEDHLALVIGDVSGKGIPSALFMVMAGNKIRHSVKKHGTNVSEAVSEVNAELMKENGARLFVAVWLGVLTISTGHMDYVNAGQEYPAICRRGEKPGADKDIHSIPVAAVKKAGFEAGSFALHSGDTVYLYTDGVTEAMNCRGEMFGKERMLAALDREESMSASDKDRAVRDSIADFVRETPQFDDITTLVLIYRGKAV